jgi:uncharacterized protein with beta-barrel porin domain
LTVAGRVAVAGAHLEITGNTSTLARATTVPLFAAAGGSSGGFATVSAPASLDTFFINRGTRQLITVERNDLPFALVASDANGHALAAALDAGRATATSDLKAVYRELGALPDTGIADGLQQLSGVSYGNAARTAALDGQRVLRLVNDRIVDSELMARPADRNSNRDTQASTSTGSTNVAAARAGLWVHTINDVASSGTPPQGGSVDGLLIGFDRALGSAWLAGGFGGYDRAALDAADQSPASSDRRYRLGGYVSRAYRHGYVNAAVSGVLHKTEAGRHITFTAMLDPALGGGALFGGIDRTTVARYDSHEISASFEGGVSHTLGHVLLQPLAGLDTSHVANDGFTESGARSVDLVADSLSASSLRLAVGMRVARASTPGTRVVPRAEVRYLDELLDPTAVLHAAFADAPATPFTIHSTIAGARGVSSSAGLVIAAGRRFSLSADYRASFAEGWRQHTITLGAGF